MTDFNLCPPCGKEELIKRVNAKAKYLKYKVLTSNLDDLVENEYYKKNCIPDFQQQMGNDNWKTATDRFNKEQYEELKAILDEAPRLEAPTLEEIDETLNSE